MSPDVTPPKKRRPYVRAVGPHLAKLLALVFSLFALTSINSLYLAGVTFLQWVTGNLYENWFYHLMAFGHVLLGLLLSVPLVVFGLIHIRNAHDRPNRRAVRMGYALFVASLTVLITGFLLVRLQGFDPVRSTATRGVLYWLHVAGPAVAAWLFVLHRLAGKRIRWRVGVRWALAGTAFALAMLLLHSHQPQTWGMAGPKDGEQYFQPSLARTATGDFIPVQALLNDDYCKQCHADAHSSWAQSAHRFSSFNNPIYLFSVLNTRRKLYEREGHARGSRFCGACHDPVPFFGGVFDDPKYDDPSYDLLADPLAQAGVTCTVCHSITSVNDPRGNGAFTIEEARHYPFAYSDNPILQWINRQMILAKPAFHKKTFLKPLHRTPEFCGACHKVHIPRELNDYKWLRGQNHYDSFLLSGVSGHGAQSFYYPAQAETNCNGCHMPRVPSDDISARDFDGSGVRSVHDHLFPSANTALPHLLGLPPAVAEAHRTFNEGVLRVDLFGVKEGGSIDGTLYAPLRPQVPTLVPGKRYLLEAVIRTLRLGHHFTQGTTDSNQVWLSVVVKTGERIIGRSGGVNAEGKVDPWSHFVNAFVLDRNGRRIDRRNVEDIFVALYDHQIPPGAAAVIHYAFALPLDVRGPVTVELKLHYRKFDAELLEHIQGEAFRGNQLPVMTLAEDRVIFPVRDASGELDNPPVKTPAWERWNDYGIGLLLKAGRTHKGELRQAESAFVEVERLGRPDGPLNRARVYVQEGRLDEAVDALKKAAAHDPPAPPWSVAWFTGIVNEQNGYLDEAIGNFRALVAMDTEETRRRGLDFSKDYRALNELGLVLFERSKQERRDRAARERMQRDAIACFQRTLALEPENVDAHWNLALLHAERGADAKAAEHRKLHATFKVDDNARDRAVATARSRYPAADHAADVVVIFDLQREGAYGLETR